MALDGTIVLEVRTDGSDDNGGGYSSDNGGTDYSQQAAAQLTLTDLACLITSTTLTSATGGFTAAMVDNLIQIKSGTNFLTGWYRITAYTDTNTVTIDRTASDGTNATAGTGSVGGALASPGMMGKLLNDHGVAGMVAWIKSGTYTITTTSQNVSGGVLYLAAYNKRLIVEGYQTIRGDRAARPVFTPSIALGANRPVRATGASTGEVVIINLEVDATAGGGSCTHCLEGGTYTTFYLCAAKNASSFGFYSGYCLKCYATGNSSSHFYGCVTWGCVAEGGSGSCNGFYQSASYYSVADSCPGKGFHHGLQGGRHMRNCVAYNCTGDGFYFSSSSYSAGYANCYAGDNGGYGFNNSSSPNIRLWNCAGYNNTSGNLNGTPMVNDNFAAITDGQPLTDPGNNDFEPNDTALRGALLRAAGIACWGQTENHDIGAVQHADPAGGGGGGLVGMAMLGGRQK